MQQNTSVQFNTIVRYDLNERKRKEAQRQQEEQDRKIAQRHQEEEDRKIAQPHALQEKVSVLQNLYIVLLTCYLILAPTKRTTEIR
jgi:hypothetical protein